MENQNNTAKVQGKDLVKIPNSMSKKQLIKMYHPMPEQIIIKEINLIIFDNRKTQKLYEGKELSQIIKTKTVFQKEILEMIAIHGLPNGYEL